MDTFHLQKLDEAAWDAGQLINTMLTETLYSRILGSAREQGLVYSMSSGFNQMSTNVSWWFGAQIMPQNAKALFDIIVRELNAVRKGEIIEADIEAAKQYMLGRYQRSGQTVSGVAAGYTNRYYFENEIDDYYAIPERIKAVTKSRVIKTTELMFTDKTWALGFLGSAGKPLADELHDQLSLLWH